MWFFIGSIDEVPTDCDLHLAVADKHELHALVFPCRRLGNSWIDAKTRRPIEIRPTTGKNGDRIRPTGSKRASILQTLAVPEPIKALRNDLMIL